ncbi:YafY family transcriptional regulator [Kibdelosporangium aridum]|uniref:YafY family transcriptional regulator n=1 Tax=Kibdelosporangium aridum TaxID=2030 RepID=A0A428Z8E1_KIBAR|nr:YafY family protein [Kibdelosporangium aridum]RSM84278.1 YafY family transcriptional regulator [Kibdelosporangium aridum]
MRASRLLSVLLLLQARGRMTAQELADELEVSVRTIYRDVESLSAAGVPVYADRGPAGGYQLLDGYRTKLTGMTTAEAETLFLSGMPDQAKQLGLGEVLAAAQLKLMAALPPELRERAQSIRERFLLDAPGWFREGESAPYLSTVAAAVWEQRRISVRYRRWGNAEVDRLLEPLGVVLKNGTWYLIAASKGEPRTYRVSRILALEPTEEKFDRPKDFDLAKYWEASAERVQDTLWRGEATVRLSPTGRKMVFLLGPVVGRALRDHEPEPDEDGWITVTVPIETNMHALHAILQLGADAEVLEPQELRDMFAKAAADLSRLYS